MPGQQIDDPFGLGLEPLGYGDDDPYGLGLEPLGYGDSAPKGPKQPQGWIDWGIEQALRTGPPVIGGILGAAVGAPEAGIGAVPMGALGAASGQVLGQSWGDWWAGKESSPAEYMIGAGAAAIPGFMPLSRAANPIMRLAGNAARSGIEGAVTNVATTPFEEWAQTGNWVPSKERVIGSGLAGGLFGAGIGGAASFLHGGGGARPVEATPPPPAAANLPWDAGMGSRGDYGNVTPPLDYNMPKGDSGSLQIPFDFDTHQPNLPLGPYRAPSGRMTNTGPALPPKYGAPVGELPIQQGAGQMPLEFGPGEQQNLFPPPTPPTPAPAPVQAPPVGAAPPQAPPQAAPNVDPTAPRFSTDKRVVVIPAPSAALNEMLRNQGYVPIPMRGPGGEVMMALGSDAPKYVTGDARPPDVPPPPPPPANRPDIPGAIGPGQVAAGDTVPVPNAKVTVSFIENMKQGGYVVSNRDGVNTYFTKDPAAEVSFQRVEAPEMDPRMAERVESQPGPRVFDASQPHPQQGNLMPMEVGNAPGMSEKDMLNLRANRLIDTSFGQPLNEPRQMSMMGDFMDAEIGKGLYDQGMEPGRRSQRNEPNFEVDESSITSVTDLGEALDNINKLDDSDPLKEVAINHFRQLRSAQMGPEFGPKVNEGKYPDNFEPQLQSAIKGRGPLRGAAKTSTVQKLYESFKSFAVGDTKRKSWIHDSGERLTPEEFKAITGSPHMKELLRVYDSIQEDIAKAVGRPNWADRLEGVGLILDSGAHGIHVPNPATGKSSIGINPFSRINPKSTPKEAAWHNVITNMHEFAHVGTEKGVGQISEADFNDPRVGDFLKSYLQQISAHKDPSTGHGLDFSNRLSEIYAKFGVERTFAAAARVESALTRGSESGGYSPEIQRLLHVYKESRGRGATTTDFLARTGTKQTDRGPDGTRSISGDTQADRDGAADGVNQAFYEENDHPEVAKFRALPDAKGFRDTRFILPDGTRKTHNEHIHEFAARKVGSSLTDALPAGVLRFTEDGAGAEIGIPLTYAQAQALKDAIAHQAGPDGNNFSRFYVDMRLPDGDIRSVGLDERMSTTGIKNRIAQYYSPEGSPKPYEGFSQESVSPEEPMMDKNDTSMWRKIKENAGWGQGVAGKHQKSEVNWIDEVLALPSAATTTMDFSAPGRQGLSMILTPQFWKAGAAMFKGLSKDGFNRIDKELMSKPLFQKKIDMNTGAVGKSTAEEIGMKLFRPASEVGPRAEGIASRWLETGGSIPLVSAAYRHTIGKGVRMSNRAYITFLNHLNANRTEFLMDKARDMAIQAFDTGSARPGIFKQKFTPQEAVNLNPYQNLQLGKDIADFVNTATGHGPLKTHILPHKSAEISLEGMAGKLGKVMFSPGLMASRIRMLNPSTYIMAPPFVRKQYVKAALSTAGAWAAFTELSKMAGAEVSDEPTSADFGKVRIGDTRIDPGGGFLQFAVLYNRMYQGGYTSSATGEFHRFGEGFQAETQLSNLMRFSSNKLNPVWKFAYDVANASEYNPFHVKDRTAQLFVPLFVQDVVDIASKNPEMIPWLGPMMFGVGAQTYSKGESVGKLVNPENDWLATGGGVADLAPDYIHPKLDY